MKPVRGGAVTTNTVSVEAVVINVDAVAERQGSRRIISERVFIGISSLLFVVSTAVTIHCCASMATMNEMPMPGGWTMSMAWMRMPGQTWFDAAASFLGMWIAMMVAMMLPALLPMLWRYRRAVDRKIALPLDFLTALVGLGYFFVWSMLGIIIFPLGSAVAALTMQYETLARAVPIAVGGVVALAGALQFSAWKAHHLACCRVVPKCNDVFPSPRTLPANTSTAWRHGLRLGLHCCYCCVNLTAILLVIGIMDLRAMAIVTAAITIERVAPASARVARIIGTVVVVAGVFLIVRAIGFE